MARGARLRLAAAYGFSLAAAAAAVFGCLEDAPHGPSASGRLRLELSWASAGGAQVKSVPVIREIDVQIHRQVEETEILLATARAEIAEGSTSFHLEVSVSEGENTSVEVAAAGSIVDEAEPPEDGLLFFGRLSGLSVVANEQTSAPIQLSPFFPRGLGAAGDLETGYRLSWGPVAGATAYRVRRFLPAGVEDRLTTQTSIDLPADSSGAVRQRLLHRVRAENTYFAGAFSDTIGVGVGPAGPPSPTALTVTALSATSILVGWDYPFRNPDLFEIERRPSGEPAWIPLEALPGSARSLIDTDLLPQTTYAYRIRAQVNLLYSAYAGPDSATTGIAPPASPTGLLAFALSPAAIRLDWTDASATETSFVIQRRIPPLGAFEPVAEVGPDVGTYIDGALLPRTDYAYRVVARNAGGDSPPSNEASDRTHPSAPTNLRVVRSSQIEIEFGWDFPLPDPELFHVEVRAFGNDWAGEVLVPGATRSYLASDLPQRSTHELRLCAEELGDLSPYSAIVAGATAPPVPDPFNGLFRDLDAQIDLGWGFPAEPDPESFEIERRVGGARFAPLPGSPFAGFERAASDADLGLGQLYTYRIRAVDRMANGADTVASGWNSVAVQTTLPPPGDPANLAATRQGTAIALAWDASSGIVEGYEIHRRRMQDASFTLYATVGGGTTSFTDLGVRPARTYTYRVRGTNAAGASGFSNEAAATTTGWRRIEVQGPKPPPRRDHQGAWAGDDRRILMYGGIPSFSDLWEYNTADSSWTEVSYPQGANPGPRSDASMAYDPLARRAFLDGGPEGFYGGFVFDRNANLWDAACGYEGQGYEARSGTGSVWNPSLGRFFGFGGRRIDGALDQSFRSYWPPQDICQLVSSGNPPSPRANHVFVATSATSAVLFGGVDSSGVLGDVYAVDFSGPAMTWTAVTPPNPGPGPRQRADGAADEIRERVYILGGYDRDGNLHNELWALEPPPRWVELDPGGAAGVTHPDATDGLLVVDPASGWLYHVGSGGNSQEVWLFVP